MTMIFPFFFFKSYLTMKRTFLGDLDFVQNKSLPNEVLYDSLWHLFVKFWNSHFLMAAILAAILNLLTCKFLRLRPKLYLIYQNLALCQIWNLYQSGIHKLKMTILYLFLLHFYVIFNLKNYFFGWPWPWIVKYSLQQIREKTGYYMILCDFIRKIVKLSFLDGGHFGGHFEFAQPTRSRSEIFGPETRIVFNMLKPCSVPNLGLVSIWGTSERLAHCTN